MRKISNKSLVIIRKPLKNFFFSSLKKRGRLEFLKNGSFFLVNKFYCFNI